jgi:hypothetical protein
MGRNEVWVFLKALGKHWITLLTGGLLMAVVAGLDLGGVMIPALLKWGDFAADVVDRGISDVAEGIC